MEKNVIQKYINNFRRNLSHYLKRNIGIQIKIYNCGSEGSVLDIEFKVGGQSFDKYVGEFGRISEALKNIKQPFFAGDLKGLHFSGTNLMMNNNKILIIKDSKNNEWSNHKLQSDLKSITEPPKREQSTYETR